MMIQLLQYKIPIGYKYDSSLILAEGLEPKTYQFDLYMNEISYIKYCLRNHSGYSINRVMTNHMDARVNYNWGLMGTYELIDEESKDVISMPSYNCCYKLSNNQQQINIIIL